jgi:hypothetical protein
MNNGERNRQTHRPLNLCRTCGKDFASIRYFDAHRIGAFAPGDYIGRLEEWEPKKGRRCLTTAELLERGYVLDPRGRWTDPKRAERGRARSLVAAAGVLPEATGPPGEGSASARRRESGSTTSEKRAA